MYGRLDDGLGEEETTTSMTNSSSSEYSVSSTGGNIKTTPMLQRQKELCDEAMALVNAGVALQSTGDQIGADLNLNRAVEIMDVALAMEYETIEETEAAGRLNKKMRRYAKMIKSQRNRSGGSVEGNPAQRTNLVDFDSLVPWYEPIVGLMHSSSPVGDIFNVLKSIFGFQEGNVLNQKEHLVLLLTNERFQLEARFNISNNTHDSNAQKDVQLTHQAIDSFHDRLFTNYRKWCRHLAQRPQFTSNQLVDIALFFLIWGEAANFRQTPEFLCYLFHKMAVIAEDALRTTVVEPQPTHDFLHRIILPMFDELFRETNKKTSKGARAPHTNIRNYDDFNEFFWSRKCLKYDIYSIGAVFRTLNPDGSGKIAKKTFKETRSWTRALLSFRRVLISTAALWLATVGFAINMNLVCPDSPIMYGSDLRKAEVFNRLYYNPDKFVSDPDEELDNDVELEEDSLCSIPKLAACLGVEGFIKGTTFKNIPFDFQDLLETVPFSNCVTVQSGRCSCYLKAIDRCFTESGIVERFDERKRDYIELKFNQTQCIPAWRKGVLNILNSRGEGKLNCDVCDFANFKFVELFQQFIDFHRKDKLAVFAFVGGVGSIGIVFLLELQNRIFSRIGLGFVGKSMPVKWSTYCRYTLFWLLLFVFKLIFDYQFMMKALVETTLFIWIAPNDYLKVSKFMIQLTYHNILYIFSLWAPAIVVFFYDTQIFYSLLSVVFGSIRGFNLGIGEVRSFRILRLAFKNIPAMFNKKIVPNIVDMGTKKSATKLEEDMPVRRFERISYSEGSKPLVVKTQKYSTLLEQSHDLDDLYTEVKTPNGTQQSGDEHDFEENGTGTSSQRSSNMAAITGISGAAFERTIPFAMAWNRCLCSLREADIISDRELNVLSYLIDSKDMQSRRLYPPAFLTAGKLDEAIDIVMECYALYDKLRSDKKKKARVLQKIEFAMFDRLMKDDLRLGAILGSYKFTSQVIRLLLGDEHKELAEAFAFMEDMVNQRNVLLGLDLSKIYQCRVACADLMKAILDVPRGINESSIKFQRSLYHVIDNMEGVMKAMKSLLSKQEALVQMMNETPLKPNSFFFPGDTQQYASVQLTKMVNDQAAMDIVSRAYQLLTVDNFDAEPRTEEGRRRLKFFVNSLFMDMPEAKPVKQMHSFSISTPYYNEIVLYSIKDLTSQNEDCTKLLFYLQTVYAFEWENFLERHGVKDAQEAITKIPDEVRLWASYRGQTLSRTIRGMMYNEEALRFLHWLEIGENEPMHLKGCDCNRCHKLDEMVTLKFNYVCTCQIYGAMKDEQRQQAHDIDYLLGLYPNLRIAYVDGPKKVKDGRPKFFSVLIRSVHGKIVEVYRVELPGNPILGEGKPENQNHAVIFSRGELLQVVDMNQDGYFEECLKMPNLLATLDRHGPKRPLTIIGFREHVFTGGVSNLASFMSIQELSFVSLGQRMLAMFDVRQHYGHPDIFNKIFAMTTGGTAKASKGINLSEDIFAGFISTLRGGLVSHEEFIQVGKGRDVGMQQLALFEAKLSSGAGECVLSRDIMRMGLRLDFFRLHSWFYGNLGWYFTQTLTVAGIYLFIYGKLYQALSGLDEYFLRNGGLGIGGVLNTSWALQLGFLLVVPVIAVIGVEKGFRHGLTYLVANVLTLGPLFFTFQMGTRMHYFDRTIIHGGAKYRATGRGFTIKHEDFAELFRFYAFSHFARGAELAFLLLLYAAYGTFSWCNCSWKIDSQFYSNIEPSELEWNRRCYANHYQLCVLPTNQNYGIMTFSLWIISATWMWAPFFFNPSGLEWDRIIEDYNDWQNWLRTKNDSSESWFGWWTSELEYLEHSSTMAKIVVFFRKSRFLLIAVGMYLNMMYRVYYKKQTKEIREGDIQPYLFSAAFGIALLIFFTCGYVLSRMLKKLVMKQRKLRKLKFHISTIVFILVLASLVFFDIVNIIEIGVMISLILFWFLQMCILRLKHQHIVVRSLARAYDRALGWIVFGPIMIVAMFLPFISAFQQRVMFNNAFTSGLEVHKLFTHDAVSSHQMNTKPASTNSKRRSKKKGKRDD